MGLKLGAHMDKPSCCLVPAARMAAGRVRPSHLAWGGGARGSGPLTPPSPGGEPARPWQKAREGPTGLAGDQGASGLWDVPLSVGCGWFNLQSAGVQRNGCPGPSPSEVSGDQLRPWEESSRWACRQQGRGLRGTGWAWQVGNERKRDGWVQAD